MQLALFFFVKQRNSMLPQNDSSLSLIDC